MIGVLSRFILIPAEDGRAIVPEKQYSHAVLPSIRPEHVLNFANPSCYIAGQYYQYQALLHVFSH